MYQLEGFLSGIRLVGGGVNNRRQDLVVFHSGDDSPSETQIDPRDHGNAAPGLRSDLKAQCAEDPAADEPGLARADDENVLVAHEIRESFGDGAAQEHDVARRVRARAGSTRLRCSDVHPDDT
ncbi:hypothetical protein [Microbacterium luteolum]|uniref:hypothetical protein n=1 Tax=Microbacterium luteolum TaxID=69367 RepID=UPI0031D36756